MRARWLARLLRRRLVVPSRVPDVYIGGRDDPYMSRWWVIPRNRWFNVYLHHVHRSDEPVMHDHPWWSVSIMLVGRVGERYGESEEYRAFSEGDVIVRSSTMRHRLVHLGNDYGWSDPWTLFVTGPVVRVWGFWCPQGWVPWEQHRDSGCGEQ